MSTAQFTCPLIVVIPGQLITSSGWNGEFQNIYTNGNTQGIGAYSDTDVQMQTSTDPFPGGVTSRPSALNGELERIRFQIALHGGVTYWYQTPVKNIAQLNTFDLGHTHTGTTDGTQIPTGGIADAAVTPAKLSASVAGNGLGGGAGTALSVNVDGSTLDISSDALLVKDSGITTAKIADLNVTTVKLAALAVTDAKVNDVATTKLTGTIATAQIANSAVDENKIAASVAGNGLAGGAGTALSVNVDGSTLEISSDSLRVKDAGITVAKLSAAVLALMSPKSIQRKSTAVVVNLGSDATATVQNTANETITSVDTTKSVICYGGCRVTAQTNADVHMIEGSARITSATNVVVTASAGPGSTPGNNNITVTVDYEVLEYN